jgi:formylglycine-generating enzyme required for sulfatase activity
MKILILASNPRKDLNLDREIRDLQQVIERSHNRQQFEVEDALAVRVGDLHDLLFKHRPEIVHFCGHGSGKQGLVFEGNEGGEHWVEAEALSDLFRLFASNVGCVLLNACYSEEQANAIVDHIDYVIGMNQEIRDDAAIAFSKGFYRALGYDCSIKEAFEFGKNAIQLEISGSSKVRSAVTEQQRKAEVVDTVTKIVIPEHLKPILRCKPTLTQDNRVVLGSQQPLSQAKREEIQLHVAKALTEEDSSQKQYRAKVREFLADRKLSKFEEIRLEQLRRNLGLSVEEANRILEEEQKPLQQARDDYQEMLIRLIDEEHYPFSSEIEANLREFRQELQLTDEELETITKPILEAAEEDYREKLKQQERQRQQEYQAKLQRYEQEFTRAIDAHYPIEQSTRDQLTQFYQSLGLSSEDIAPTEQQIIAPKEAEYQRRLVEEQLKQEAAAQQALKNQEVENSLDLTLELALTSTEMLHGTKKRIELENGAISVNVPSDVTAGKRIRLRGKGKLNPVNQQSGDLYLLIVKSQEQENIRKPELIPFNFQVATVTAVGDEVTVEHHSRRAEYFVEDLGNGITLEMVAIPGGTFTMGSPEDELERSNTEGPQHIVTIQPFYMGKFAVTQAQWRAIAALPKVNCELNADPSHFKGNNRPVEKISWFEAVEFCERLNRFVEGRNSRKTGTSYRLPSEAQWEYACCAGTVTPFHVGKTITTDLANYHGDYIYGAGKNGNNRRQTTDVGSFPPNAFGLYDMHGNVWEWCADYWHSSYERAPVVEAVWTEGGDKKYQLIRGGSWNDTPAFCRSACRYFYDPVDRRGHLGFRVVCVLA